MNAHLRTAISRADPGLPLLATTGALTLAVRAGTVVGDVRFADETPVSLPDSGLEAGGDYAVIVGPGATASAVKLVGNPADSILHAAGFHVAPGGNAAGRAGGDETPSINPFSMWDLGFRPACPDPRGMALVEAGDGHLFWCDIYLLAEDHLDGTSRLGAEIADDDNPPENLNGEGYFRNLDYETAKTVLAHHGKQLLSIDEFFAAAFGVTEKTASGSDPKVTGLDAARTSRRGIIQATGNMWVWGHDGDPDDPRPCIFGGSWLTGGDAGSRFAGLDYWPDYSSHVLGARGRCDHLIPA